MDSPKPKRRWFRFSLRTMFVVVTVLCVWLGYAIPWIKARRAFLAQPDIIAVFNDSPPQTVNRWGNSWRVFAPHGLWLLGERGLVSVWIPPKIWSPEREAEAERLFPEALLLRVDAKGGWSSRLDPDYFEVPPMTTESPLFLLRQSAPAPQPPASSSK